jgi:hypothetical protein
LHCKTLFFIQRVGDHVKKLNNKSGFIDLFWPQALLVEQKSAGRDLAKAVDQAGEYFDALKDSEQPHFQLVCDFQNFELLDRETRQSDSFKLAELPHNIELFNFISGPHCRSGHVDDGPHYEQPTQPGIRPNLHPHTLEKITAYQTCKRLAV